MDGHSIGRAILDADLSAYAIHRGELTTLRLTMIADEVTIAPKEDK